MNLTDYRVTPVSKAFAAVKEEALKLGIDILESELVGLIPEAASRHQGRGYPAIEFPRGMYHRKASLITSTSD